MQAIRASALWLFVAASACVASADSGPPGGPSTPPSNTDAGAVVPTEVDGAVTVASDAAPDANVPDVTAAPECVQDTDCVTEPRICGVEGNAAGHCLRARSCDGRYGTWSCGPLANEDCCAHTWVPGGTFDRNGNPSMPATVSAFELDRFEVTVGRLRTYFEAVGGRVRDHAPAAGAGAHPLIVGSGWRDTFTIRLPNSWGAIHDRLGASGCTKGGNNADGGTATWTQTVGPYETKPITCIDWYTMFAFCQWDDGRIPTDAEMGFAAMGGNEERWYAWAGPVGDLNFPTHKNFVVTGLLDPSDHLVKQTWGPLFRTQNADGSHIIGGPEMIAPPGQKPLGNGKWGHADLTGNVLEWTLDEGPVLPSPCVDCANVEWPDPPQDQIDWYPPQWPQRPDGSFDETTDGARTMRGGSWDITHGLSNYSYYVYDTYRTYGAVGGRCAR